MVGRRRVGEEGVLAQFVFFFCGCPSYHLHLCILIEHTDYDLCDVGWLRWRHEFAVIIRAVLEGSTVSAV